MTDSIPNGSEATTSSAPSGSTEGQSPAIALRNEKLDPRFVEADGLTIDLKNRHFAALLGLLFPGAGHFYQGRKNKALLYAICILGLFATGMFLGHGRVVYMSWKDEDYRLQFPAQMCVGLPALPALLHANATAKLNGRNVPNDAAPEPLTWETFMAPPVDLKELSRWHFQSSAGFELGTLMTAVAGLLNILAVFDALAGPIAPVAAKKKEEEV